MCDRLHVSRCTDRRQVRHWQAVTGGRIGGCRSGHGRLGIDGAPEPEIRKLIAAGAAVGGIDLLYQGELNADGKAPEKTRRVNGDRNFAGYTWNRRTNTADFTTQMGLFPLVGLEWRF